MGCEKCAAGEKSILTSGNTIKLIIAASEFSERGIQR